jgi:hypothetical protein
MSPLSHPLHLLVPWELPTQIQLSDVHQAQLCRTLSQFLRSLKQPPRQAIAILDHELAVLDAGKIVPVNAASTKTLLKVWEVEDFDHYFDAIHVQAQEPAICLVMSLLLSYRVFLILIQQEYPFEQRYVEQQKRGFASYAYLLARVFDLNLEKA